MAEAGPEVIEALLLERHCWPGQGLKTKDLERPEMSTQPIGLAQIYVT